MPVQWDTYVRIYLLLNVAARIIRTVCSGILLETCSKDPASTRYAPYRAQDCAQCCAHMICICMYMLV